MSVKRKRRGADVSFASLADVSARLRDGEISSVELTERALARIEKLNPRLNAFITVIARLARLQAGDADAELRNGRWRGALHGVPVAVKDFYDTAGIRTTAAFEGFERRVPGRDAAMVAALRGAGAVLMGKTNMHRLGMGTTSLESAFGPVVNPWNRRRVAGGSSGGSAVAVASGLCFATIDTDAVGSGRLPAAICGVTCLKPTFGVLSPAGILDGVPVPDPAIPLLSHPSVMARSAEDVALAFEAIAPRPPISDEPRVGRIGVATNFAGTKQMKAMFARAVKRLVDLSVSVHEVRVPFEKATFDVRSIEEDRSGIDAALFAGVDAIVLPTLTTAVPTISAAREAGEQAVSAENTFFCNYFGLPAISVPMGAGAAAALAGLQFVGPHGSDRRLLALAAAYQRAVDWSFEPPESALSRR